MVEKTAKFTRDAGLKKLKKLIKLGKIDDAKDLCSNLRARYPADKKIHNQYKSLNLKIKLGNTRASNVSINYNNFIYYIVDNRQLNFLIQRFSTVSFPDSYP